MSTRNAKLIELQARFAAHKDNSYSRMIEAARRDEALGWEAKVDRGIFGAPELEAHKKSRRTLRHAQGLQPGHEVGHGDAGNPEVQMTDTTFLVTQGWEPSTHGGWLYSKAFPTTTRCGFYKGVPGIQVTFRFITSRDYFFELRGQLPDGTWASVTRHRLPDDIEEGLKVIPGMLKVWELLCQSAPAAPTT